MNSSLKIQFTYDETISYWTINYMGLNGTAMDSNGAALLLNYLCRDYLNQEAMYNMSKLFNSDDDDLGYLDDSIHINWKKLLPAIIIVAAAVIALIIVLIVSFSSLSLKVLFRRYLFH